jgi:pSer/pThr/pTyr-binding forkhead associated (FHA) protein
MAPRARCSNRRRSPPGHLEDLGSSNGTFVRLRATHPLAPGDLIRLGDVLLGCEQS